MMCLIIEFMIPAISPWIFGRGQMATEQWSTISASIGAYGRFPSSVAETIFARVLSDSRNAHTSRQRAFPLNRRICLHHRCYKSPWVMAFQCGSNPLRITISVFHVKISIIKPKHFKNSLKRSWQNRIMTLIKLSTTSWCKFWLSR